MTKRLVLRGLLLSLVACLLLVGCSGGDASGTPQPTETPRPASRVVVPQDTSLSFAERLEQWLISLEARILGEYENVEGLSEAQLAINPIPIGNERQPNYAIFVRARLDDAGADREATARALLTRAQNAVETTLVEFSALLNAGDSFTNYRWSSVSDNFTREDLTSTFATNAGEAPIDVDQIRFLVSFPTELRICPRTSCSSVGSLPRGTMIELGDAVPGQSVLGRQEWYVADYFGLPVYVPFARVTRARN